MRQSEKEDRTERAKMNTIKREERERGRPTVLRGGRTYLLNALFRCINTFKSYNGMLSMVGEVIIELNIISFVSKKLGSNHGSELSFARRRVVD
jgi:hypothetical protein